MKRALAAVLLAAVAVTPTVPASARVVVPAEKRYDSYSGELPPCSDPSVLSTITDRFAGKESEYWNSTLEITGYDHFRSIGIRPWGLDHIPRTFCEARVMLNDHSIHEVFYSINEDLGFSGFGDGVTWCVTGLDRNFAFSPGCKEARP